MIFKSSRGMNVNIFSLSYKYWGDFILTLKIVQAQIARWFPHLPCPHSPQLTSEPQGAMLWEVMSRAAPPRVTLSRKPSFTTWTSASSASTICLLFFFTSSTNTQTSQCVLLMRVYSTNTQTSQCVLLMRVSSTNTQTSQCVLLMRVY